MFKPLVYTKVIILFQLWGHNPFLLFHKNGERNKLKNVLKYTELCKGLCNSLWGHIIWESIRCICCRHICCPSNTKISRPLQNQTEDDSASKKKNHRNVVILWMKLALSPTFDKRRFYGSRWGGGLWGGCRGNTVSIVSEPKWRFQHKPTAQDKWMFV